jgi:GT2 family glycosyltransferase
VLINPDVLLIDKSINQIIEKMERDQTIGIAGPKLLNEDRSYQVSFVRFPSLSALIKEHIFLSRKNPYAQGLNDEVEQACDVIKGACLFIRRDIVIGDKLFDEDFVMYSEEVDLCHRVKQAGYEIKYIPSCTVIHYGERSSSPKKAREYSTYHYFKSKLIFARKQQSIWDYLITRLILSVSLTEKIIMLFLIGHFYNSAVHLKVFIRLVFAHIHISSANVQIKRCE